MPKVDLHRHLEGSVRPKSLLEIAEENKILLPTYNLDKLTSLVTISKPKSNLKSFVEPLEIVVRCFCKKEAIQRITYEAVEDAYKDNIRYLELVIGFTFAMVGQDPSLYDIFDGVTAGIKKAQRDFPIKVNIIAGISPMWRQYNSYSPDEIFQTALSYRNDGIIGVGLVTELKDGTLLAFEKKDVWKNFIKLSKKVKKEELFVVVHSGEVGEADSVRNAISYLDADRVGHGINVVKDVEILRQVVDRKVPFEVCLTSNILSGAVSTESKHPLRKMLSEGVNVTLNTDDPALCKTTLTREYLLAKDVFRLDIKSIIEIGANTISASFLSKPEKDQLMSNFLDWWNSFPYIEIDN